MEVKNCRKCKRLFNYISGQQICPKCREELENKFQEVKDFLYKNHNATIRNVSEACDVEEMQIKQWIREERLEFRKGIDAGITCEVCGAAISTGKYCENCKSSMINTLESASRSRMRREEIQKTAAKQHENKMRFLNRK